MDIETLTAFFMWCTIINGGMLAITSLICMAARNVVCTMHSKIFGIPEQAVRVAIFSFLGLYKMLFIVFCVVPYVALLIIQ